MRITERPLFYWVLNRYRGLQIFLLLVIVVSLFFRVYPLEMQRKIINIAINLRMIDKLYLYCALYLGAVLVAGLLKYLTNTLQDIVGQKILISMRQELYEHILQLPLSFYHRTQVGTVISAMTAELNAIGSFLGGAITIPVTSILTFMVFLGFMIYLNPMLGLLSMIVYPLELVVIPLLQKRFNRFNRKRLVTTRRMASLVNESVTGIHEVQANAAFLLEQKKLDRLLYRVYDLAVRLAIFKYGIKFSNNLFQSLGPFLLFLVGGYLAIHGQFTIGALVAFLSAYEKVYDPWQETINYYQDFQDARVRYKQIMDLFNLSPEFSFLPSAPHHDVVSGSIEAKGVGYRVNETVHLLDDITFSLPAGSHLALVGYSGSGKSTLGLLIGQLYRQTTGTIKLDGRDIGEMSKVEVADAIGSVSQLPFIFTGTVRDNLLYSSQSLVMNKVRQDLPESSEIFEIIKEVGLVEDVVRWGLRSTIPPGRVEPMIPSFLHMRDIIRNELRGRFSKAVEFYDVTAFLSYVPLAINIIFGSYGIAYTVKNLLRNQEFREFLAESDLENPLTELGYQIARSTINLLGDFHEDAFFFKGSPMNADQFQQYKELVDKARTRTLAKMRLKDRERFLLLALKFTPGIHKIATITEAFEAEIISARQKFLKQVADIDMEACANGTIQQVIAPYRSPMETEQKQTRPQFVPFCINQYLPSHSLRDNILFGTVTDQELLRGVLGRIAFDEFEHHGLLDDIMEIGLDFHVGSKGDNLSGGQKQKIALARALLKKSPVLLLDEATASLDNSSQARVQRYISSKLKGATTVIAVVHRLDLIAEYDHILVMKDGKIVESGKYDDLISRQGDLYALIHDHR